MGMVDVWAVVVVAGCFLVVAGGFLLLGWRMGRESLGRPMFEFPGPFEALAGDGDALAGDELDPWDAAMKGEPGEAFAGIDR